MLATVMDVDVGNVHIMYTVHYAKVHNLEWGFPNHAFFWGGGGESMYDLPSPLLLRTSSRVGMFANECTEFIGKTQYAMESIKPFGKLQIRI